MGAKLNNITTSDAYTEAATLHQPDSAGVLVQIGNAGVYYQLDLDPKGNGRWSQEGFLVRSIGTLGRRCSGIRLRSAAAGTPAQVSVELVTAEELSEGLVDSLSPFDAQITPAGQIGTTQLTGRVNADGSIAGGTGFTVVRTGAGQYTVTFDVAFAAIPAVLANWITAYAVGDTRFQVTTVSASDFTCHSVVAGNSTDRPFHFAVVAL